ncbi:hypothetical protein R5W24_006588 [Gemmata sp. JC717]|uniref:hypothetical protein n=1 Tax=Gemmata algarum TaxID=2975278 RepID=UPI0021BA889E|nr:hypothetical protein [Gemmata algarum]MDY3557397.1 hypothetical protein [Gemmata algarum]
MPTLTLAFEYSTDAERRTLEQTAAYLRELTRLAHEAEHGTVLAVCEQLALGTGRQLLRDQLGAAFQARAEAMDAPKKNPAPATRVPGVGGC